MLRALPKGQDKNDLNIRITFSYLQTPENVKSLNAVRHMLQRIISTEDN